MNQQPTDEALARGLVVRCLPEMEAALMAGRPFRAMVEALIETRAATWTAHHGAAIARRAGEILDGLGPATVLTPYGRDRFIGEGPVVEIRPPGVGIQGGTPREAIGAWAYFGRLFRLG